MDFQSAKQEYQRIRAPEELGRRVEAVLARETGRRRGRRWERALLPLAASVLLVFTAALNASPALAASLLFALVLYLAALSAQGLGPGRRQT